MEAIRRDVIANAGLRSAGSFRAILALGVGASMLFPLYGVCAQSVELPEGPGKAVVMENCTACHGSEVITAKRRPPVEWEQVVNRMLSNGAVLTDDQQTTVLTYLKKYLATPATSSTAPAPGVKPGAK